MKKKIKNFLPIGSVVRIKKPDSVLVVYSYLNRAASPEDNQVRQYDYIGIPYPSGYLDDRFMIPFQSEDITEVIHRGYEDESRQVFLEKLAEVYGNEENQSSDSVI